MLEVDAKGETTARKLYAFLELDKSNYSKWAKVNILNNRFAEENIDFVPFALNGECGGQATIDYKLAASFAKKLAMASQSERGEQARNYFIKVEDLLKQNVLKRGNIETKFIPSYFSNFSIETRKTMLKELESKNSLLADEKEKIDNQLLGNIKTIEMIESTLTS